MNDKYSERLEILKSLGFVEDRVGFTNGKYAFLYHQIDTSELTDEQFQDFVDLVKKEKSESDN